VLATGAAAGQVVGGVLVGADLCGPGWRPVFLVNVPIGLVLLVLGSRVLPREPCTAPGRAQARARGLDLPGLVLLAAAVTLLTVPLVLGQELDWPVWSRLCMAASVGLFAGFAGYESWPAARGGAPLIAPGVLRVPGITPGGAAHSPGDGDQRRLPFCHDAARAGRPGLFAVAGGADVRTDRAGVRLGRTDLAAVARPAPRGSGARRVRTHGGRSVAVGLLMRGGGDGEPALYAAFAAMGIGLALGFSPTSSGRWRTYVPRMRPMRAAYW
jgi:hypothetical protein